jgi:hypothetical protein
MVIPRHDPHSQSRPPPPGDNTPLDQGLVPPETLPFEVCEDTNDNGVCEDGEPPATGAHMYLGDHNDPNTPVLTTDPNGEVLFEEVPMGEYPVTVISPNSYTPTENDEDRNLDTPPTQPVTMDPGVNDAVNQGLNPTRTAPGCSRSP